MTFDQWWNEKNADRLIWLSTPMREIAREAWAAGKAPSPEEKRINDQQVAELLVDLELLNFMEAGAARHHRKAEYQRIREFLISLAPNVVLPEHEAKPTSCPHADPFVYCPECKVSPCPMGLSAPSPQRTLAPQGNQARTDSSESGFKAPSGGCLPNTSGPAGAGTE